VNAHIAAEGMGVCYKNWDGRANFDTIELDSPTGHIEEMTVRGQFYSGYD
jgi:hypothetical protein